MKRMFLTSDVHFVAKSIAAKLPQSVNKLKTVFINTAAEPEEEGGIEAGWVKENRQGLVDAGFNLFDYTITGKNQAQIDKDLAGVDVFQVNGGNMFYLLLQMRKSGFDKFIVEKVNQGKIYIGSSSGAIVAGPDISVLKVFNKPTFEDELKDLTGLNLVNFEIYPHWGKDDFHEEYFSDRLEYGYQGRQSIILLPDNQYIEVTGDSYKIISV